MQQLHEAHQAHFFTVNDDISATPKVLSSLLNVLGEFGVMPTFAKALNTQTGESKQYVIMLSADETLRIEFPLDRIIIATEGKSCEDFFSLVSPILESLATEYPAKTANRLSIVTTNIYGAETSAYDVLYKNLFTYRQANPFEWDNRVAQKGELDGEELNVISTIRRCEVSSNVINSGNTTDVVVSEIDINTAPINTAMRFTIDSASSQLSGLFTKNKEARSKLARYFEND